MSRWFGTTVQSKHHTVNFLFCLKGKRSIEAEIMIEFGEESAGRRERNVCWSLKFTALCVPHVISTVAASGRTWGWNISNLSLNRKLLSLLRVEFFPRFLARVVSPSPIIHSSFRIYFLLLRERNIFSRLKIPPLGDSFVPCQLAPLQTWRLLRNNFMSLFLFYAFVLCRHSIEMSS